MNRSVILLVDDSEPARTLLQVQIIAGLAPRSVDVVEADGVEGALQILSKISVSVIVSDVRMPGISGIEFLNLSKANYPDIPFILVSTDATSFSDPGAIKLADGHCDKNDHVQIIELVKKSLP